MAEEVEQNLPPAQAEKAQAAPELVAIPVREASEPSERLQPLPLSAPTPVSARYTPTEEGDVWHATVQQLVAAEAITALVRELALQSQLVARDGGHWLLRVERESLKDLCAGNLRWAAAEAARAGCDILIEPINLRDVPRYFLNRQDHAHELLDAVQADNLQVLMDLYHCQIVEGDVATKLQRYLPTGRVAHVQIAGVPGRHEPDRGELHYPFLFETLDALGYSGWVGCEYRPAADTSAGLVWRDRALAGSAER